MEASGTAFGELAGKAMRTAFDLPQSPPGGSR